MEVKRLGIIRGGEKHYEISLREGGEIISHVFYHLSHKWKPVDILIDQLGEWHAGGVPISLEELRAAADVFWDTTRSDEYLSLPDLPVVNVSGGSATFSEEGRKMFAEHMKKIGIKTLRHILIPAYQNDFDGPLEKYVQKKAAEVLSKFSPPWRVRLFPGDPRLGSRLVKTFPELVEAILDGVKYERSILVEEYIGGKVAATHSVLGFRGKDIYVFPAAGSNKEEKELLAGLAESLHTYVPGAYYVSAGFILHSRGTYLADLEFSPDLGEDSHLSKSCELIGVKTHHVLDHILDQFLG